MMQIAWDPPKLLHPMNGSLDGEGSICNIDTKVERCFIFRNVRHISQVLAYEHHHYHHPNHHPNDDRDDDQDNDQDDDDDDDDDHDDQEEDADDPDFDPNHHHS